MSTNKISGGLYFPRIRTPLIKNLLTQIETDWGGLLDKRKGKDRDEVGMALHRLKEALVKLDYRYFDLTQVVQMFDNLQDDELGEPLHYLQIAFVDRVEAFHQQVYSTISTLILVLNFLKPTETDTTHPINSVEQFLNFVKEKKLKYRSVLIDQVDCLQKSRDFRSKFIDHPQQHQLHDWMTFKAEDGNLYLIFFIRKGNEVYAINPTLNPSDPDFKPPVNCGKDFYVAPNETPTLKAIDVLIKHLLNL